MENRSTALITGSGIRLGKAIAMDLAKRGCDIAIHYNQSHKDALETVSAIKSSGVDCEAFQYDLEKANEWEGFLKAVMTRFPDLNILVNSASMYSQAKISETDSNTFDKQMAVNIRAPFFLSKYFAKHCKKGNIINIIDNKVSFNQNTYAAYLLTKKSLVEFTKMAAIEFAPQIRVNGVAPGVTLPTSIRSPEYMKWRIEGIPLKMKGETYHITQAIVSILENEFITGQIITVDGGEGITNIGRNAGDYHS
ncbi:MAG: SDR family oxidoreductase [Leptospiraceae bacterium]|nr:SDR family oxidoreductase [Leptospiraceae bacterium]MCP5497875.1 SDR family oxidoreductase [Leptospiraceae bacterium]